MLAETVVDLVQEATDRTPDANFNSEQKPKPKSKPKDNSKNDTPDVTCPGDDPTVAPDGYEWVGKDKQGGKRGGYKNKNGKDSWHPDLDHPDGVGPHWDYNDGRGGKWRIFPNGIEKSNKEDHMTEQEKLWKENIYKNGLNDYDYLLNLSISFRVYSEDNDDHVHCELCWDKISMHESDLHCGYVSTDKKIWLCSDCVKSFKQLFHWKITNEQ